MNRHLVRTTLGAVELADVGELTEQTFVADVGELSEETAGAARMSYRRPLALCFGLRLHAVDPLQQTILSGSDQARAEHVLIPPPRSADRISDASGPCRICTSRAKGVRIPPSGTSSQIA